MTYDIDQSRRRFLGAAAGAAVTGSAAAPAWGGGTLLDAMGGFFQDHYQRMSDEEIADALGRTAGYCFGVSAGCPSALGLEDNTTVFYAPPLTWTATVEYRF
jgi:hypothetical protein